MGLVLYWIAVTAMLYSSGSLTAYCRPEGSGPIMTYNDYRSLLLGAQQPFSRVMPLLNHTMTQCYKNATT